MFIKSSIGQRSKAWYNLSDPGMEKQLARDLLFRRFVGLNLSESVPEHSTIWRFRNLLQKEGLLDAMLERINTHLARASLIVTRGSISIVDATVNEAKQSRPKKNKKGENTQTLKRRTRQRYRPMVNAKRRMDINFMRTRMKMALLRSWRKALRTIMTHSILMKC